jgi:hypothetical protein
VSRCKSQAAAGTARQGQKDRVIAAFELAPAALRTAVSGLLRRAGPHLASAEGHVNSHDSADRDGDDRLALVVAGFELMRALEDARRATSRRRR